jgi:hypothetical protein
MSNLLQNSQLPIGSGKGVEARYLTERGDPVLYLRMPFLDSQLPRGKRWIRLDLQRSGSTMGVNFNQLLGEAGQSPTQLLDLLQASEQVKKVGPDIVGGAKVTQYRGVIDLRRALRARGVSATAIDQCLPGQPPTIPVDVWIGDGDGLGRQMRDLGTQIGGQTVKTATRRGSPGGGCTSRSRRRRRPRSTTRAARRAESAPRSERTRQDTRR